MSVSDDYARFASVEARGQSPLYEVLAASISKDPAVLDLIGSLPEAKRQPNLLLASVRFLGGPVEDYADFARWLHDHWESVRATIHSRRTQTNEPGRCAVLLPALRQRRHHSTVVTRPRGRTLPPRPRWRPAGMGRRTRPDTSLAVEPLIRTADGHRGVPIRIVRPRRTRHADSGDPGAALHPA